MKVLLLIILQLLFIETIGFQLDETSIDLKPDWKISSAKGFEKYNGQPVRTIHLMIDNKFKSGRIKITAPDEFAVFINGRIQFLANRSYTINVDSLLLRNSGTPMLSIFQHQHAKSLETTLLIPVNLDKESFVRGSTHFSDFVIISALLLFGFFVILFRSNTRLTIDYLNLFKVVSLQEREEAIVTGRIGSSANIFFFIFISMLWALLLTIFFERGPAAIRFSSWIEMDTTIKAVAAWVLLSIFIFLLLMTKLLLIWTFSRLFALWEVVRFQFFNFIRSLYIASAFMSVALLVYFMIGAEKINFYYSLLLAACIFLIFSVLLLYFKLMSRAQFSVFHLFSYLCGSEIIPLLILIKVLLN